MVNFRDHAPLSSRAESRDSYPGARFNTIDPIPSVVEGSPQFILSRRSLDFARDHVDYLDDNDRGCPSTSLGMTTEF